MLLSTAWAKDGNRAPLETYLETFVRGPSDHIEYLERVGLRRLLALNEY